MLNFYIVKEDASIFPFTKPLYVSFDTLNMVRKAFLLLLIFSSPNVFKILQLVFVEHWSVAADKVSSYGAGAAEAYAAFYVSF